MASDSTSLTNLSSVYTWVVDDVTKNVRDEFLNEGVDPQVLEELKQLWLAKIDLTKAVSRPRVSDPPPLPPPLHSTSSASRSSRAHQPKEPALPPVPPLIERSLQSSPSQESVSVIQHAPPRSQTTPTSTTPPPSHTLTPSPCAALVGYPAGTGLAVATPTGVQFIPQPIMGAGGLAPFPAGAQFMVTTSQGPMVLPLGAMLAMQQRNALAAAAAQAQVQQAQAQAQAKLREGGSGSSASSSGENIRQSDGPPPPLVMEGGRTVYRTDVEDGGVFTGPHCVNEGDGLCSIPTQVTTSTAEPNASDAKDSDAQFPRFHIPIPIPSSTVAFPVSQTSVSISQTPIPASGTTILVEPTPCHHHKTSSKRTALFEFPDAFPSRGKYPWVRDDGEGVRVRGEVCEVIPQLDGAGGGGKGMERGGGGRGSSSEDDSEDDDTSDEDDVDVPPDSDPLCSDDDIGSEKSETEDFETHDSIVCQWEKVYRVKAKWKFNLKEGVMHVAGHDYIFQKAIGEADW